MNYIQGETIVKLHNAGVGIEINFGKSLNKEESMVPLYLRVISIKPIVITGTGKGHLFHFEQGATVNSSEVSTDKVKLTINHRYYNLFNPRGESNAIWLLDTTPVLKITKPWDLSNGVSIMLLGEFGPKFGILLAHGVYKDIVQLINDKKLSQVNKDLKLYLPELKDGEFYMDNTSVMLFLYGNTLVILPWDHMDFHKTYPILPITINPF